MRHAIDALTGYAVWAFAFVAVTFRGEKIWREVFTFFGSDNES